MNQLTSDFLIELFHLCLKEKQIYENIAPFIEYSYFPSEPYKKIWKNLHNKYVLDQSLPSIGILSQTFETDEKVLDILKQIKVCNPPILDMFLTTFETFIKKCMFVKYYEEVAVSYNKGGDKEEAFAMSIKFSEDIQAFTLKKPYYEPIFSKFADRYQQKYLSNLLQSIDINNFIFSFGIDEIDYHAGTPKKGDLILITAESGKGKSQMLKWIAISNARKGAKVLHFQLEGTKEECYEAYDAAWTGSFQVDIENTTLPQEKLNNIIAIASKIQGEIYVECPGQFDSITCVDIDHKITELEKIYGKFQLIVVDYCELTEPGDGKKYSPKEERFRREAIVNRFKNIAVKHDLILATATQATDVIASEKKLPDFVLTRSNISEFKGIVRPFSYHFTINHTNTEYDQSIARIYCDKFRKRKSGQIVKLATGFDRQRFYNKKRTLELFTPTI